MAGTKLRQVHRRLKREHGIKVGSEPTLARGDYVIVEILTLTTTPAEQLAVESCSKVCLVDWDRTEL